MASSFVVELSLTAEQVKILDEIERKFQVDRVTIIHTMVSQHLNPDLQWTVDSEDVGTLGLKRVTANSSTKSHFSGEPTFSHTYTLDR